MPTILSHDTDISLDELRHQIDRDITSYQGWYMFEGFLFITAGILAIALPLATSFAIEGLIGALLFIAGVMRMINGARFSRGRKWRLLSGLVFAGAGGAVLWWPLAGASLLSLALGVLLLAEGIADILISLAYRPAFRWGALLFSGVLNLLLASFIFIGFPLNGMIFLSVIVGISLAVYGFSILVLTMGYR